uniref:Glycosyltransferase n=1 Tax=Oryza glumipatula TaxID=40148 RepID=A0A0E0AH10_9ORYZ
MITFHQSYSYIYIYTHIIRYPTLLKKIIRYPTLSNNPAMSEAVQAAADASSSSSSSPLHIVVFPWLAFGHMIPFLELSKRLASRGNAVTLVSTPRNAARLGAIPPALSANLRVVPLDLPAVDGLPEGAESTADVPPEKVGLLKKAFDGLAAPFASLVAEDCGGGSAGDGEEAAAGFSRRPDWIILDFAQNWLWPIAEEHEIPCAVFFIIPAAIVTFIGPKQENITHPRTTTEDYMVAPPWVPFPSTLTYRRHEAEWIAAAFQPNASGVSDVDRLLEMERSCCRLIVYRSCPEAEPRLFPLLNKLFARPAVPAGLLLPADIVHVEDAPNTTSDQSFVSAIQWLDKQPNGSVIYVALGSEAPITTNHVRELALGLELSSVRFLWALRPPSGINSQTRTFLPSGFESRVATRGIVCTEWVPQVRVLAHGAIGAFLTHCGWGSTVESFCFGHPLVMLPFVADQGLIAQAMAARGIGVEVARNYDDGSFYRDDVATAVRRVMVEEEGKVLARKAKEVHSILGDRAREEQYLDEFVGYLQRYK